MSFRPFDASDGGGGGGSELGFPPWHIIAGEVITVPTRREMALHGEFLNEGTLLLEGTSRLILED